MSLTRKQKWILGFVVAALIKVALVGVWFMFQAWRHPHFTQAQIRLPDQSVVQVEVADSWREQEWGLMGRTSLVSDTGMLFVFQTPARYPFWMKNTQIDLDYVWLLSGTVVDLTANVPAGDGLPDTQVARVTPRTEVDWALEVPAGFIAEHHLRVGDMVTLEP